jgi:NAD(P)-dependent dehydrogenase (short-subunit alcohol dehydrogenase family)
VCVRTSIELLDMGAWSLISPASRGIGFALARRVLQTTHAPVVATARRDLDKTREELLSGLDIDEKRLTLLELDVLSKLFEHIS